MKFPPGTSFGGKVWERHRSTRPPSVTHVPREPCRRGEAGVAATCIQRLWTGRVCERAGGRDAQSGDTHGRAGGRQVRVEVRAYMWFLSLGLCMAVCAHMRVHGVDAWLGGVCVGLLGGWRWQPQ